MTLNWFVPHRWRFLAVFAFLLLAWESPSVLAQCNDGAAVPNGQGGILVTCDSAGGTAINAANVTNNDTIVITVNGNPITGTMRGGDGNDTITNSGVVNATIFGNNGNDQITNLGTANNVHGDDGIGGIGNDIVTNLGTITSQLVGGGGNDIINNTGFVGTGISGDDGNDTITNSGDTPNINGGNDDDLIIILNGSRNSATNVQNIEGGIGGLDVLQFNFSATEDEAAAFGGQFAAFAGCGGVDGCNGAITFRGQTYNFSNFEQLLNLVQVIASQVQSEAQASASNFDPSIPRVIFDNRIVKVFQIFSDQEFYGGFGPNLVNGFLIGKIPASALDFNACKRFQDSASPWYLIACPERSLFLISVFDEKDLLITQFLSPVIPSRSDSSASGAAGSNTSRPAFTANPYLRVGDVGVALDGVIIRVAPSLNAEKTGQQIGWGEFVTILAEDSTGYWFLVQSQSGKQGWVANEWFAPPGQYRSRGGGFVPLSPD